MIPLFENEEIIIREEPHGIPIAVIDETDN